jgi:RimJ/RimL family protein N-acetyltransferase
LPELDLYCWKLDISQIKKDCYYFQMDIVLAVPSENDVLQQYESYRGDGDGEPGSPIIPFDQLSTEEQNKKTQAYKIFIKSVRIQGQGVGWVSIIDKEDKETINLGFGLFKKHRGQGLMAKIIPVAVSYIMKNCSQKPITSGARVQNFAANISLEKAGFIFIKNSFMTDPAGSDEVFEYKTYKYPHWP